MKGRWLEEGGEERGGRESEGRRRDEEGQVDDSSSPSSPKQRDTERETKETLLSDR